MSVIPRDQWRVELTPTGARAARHAAPTPERGEFSAGVPRPDATIETRNPRPDGDPFEPVYEVRIGFETSEPLDRLAIA